MVGGGKWKIKIFFLGGGGLKKTTKKIESNTDIISYITTWPEKPGCVVMVPCKKFFIRPGAKMKKRIPISGSGSFKQNVSPDPDPAVLN